MKFTAREMRSRAIRRLAEVMHDHWDEGRDGHSRIFEVLVPDEMVIDGISAQGGHYREHIVPCVVIREGCKQMYSKGATVDEVARAIDKHLRIVLISTDEAHRLDHELGLKTLMPSGWVFGKDEPMARINAAGITLDQSDLP
jgi:hypothetical protein